MKETKTESKTYRVLLKAYLGHISTLKNLSLRNGKA